MSQVNITVDYEEVVALFSKDKNDAFAYLMEKILNAFLLAESEEQIGTADCVKSLVHSNYVTSILMKKGLPCSTNTLQPFLSMTSQFVLCPPVLMATLSYNAI